MNNFQRGNVFIAALIFVALALTTAGGLYLWQTRPAQPPAAGVTKEPLPSSVPSDANTPTTTAVISQPITASPTPADATANWKTYTTDEKMDIDDAMFKLFPNLKTPSLSFNYPSQWTVVKVSPELAKYVYKNTNIHLGFELRKDDPKYSPCLSEGPCENFANITLKLGVVPPNLKNFDSDYWGQGYPIEKETDTTTNGMQAVQAYTTKNAPFPMGTIFRISSTVQLYVISEFFNYNDPKYENQYSKDTVREINRILATFRFD